MSTAERSTPRSYSLASGSLPPIQAHSADEFLRIWQGKTHLRNRTPAEWRVAMAATLQEATERSRGVPLDPSSDDAFLATLIQAGLVLEG